MTISVKTKPCSCRCGCTVHTLHGICGECKYRCPMAERTGKLDLINELVTFAEFDSRAETVRGWVGYLKEKLNSLKKL